MIDSHPSVRFGTGSLYILKENLLTRRELLAIQVQNLVLLEV